MVNKFKICLNLPNKLKIEVLNLNKELSEFTSRQLNKYVIKTEKLITSDNNITINTNLTRDISGNLNSLSKNIKIKNKVLSFDLNLYNEQLSYYYDFKTEIRINVESRQSFISKVKKIRKSKYSKLHIEFYQKVLFPIFSLYTLLDGYYLIHGSMVNYNKKNHVFCGLDGVGKSSICNLFFNKGGDILADNFLLFNGVNFMPLNMAIRLEASKEHSLTELYRDKQIIEVDFVSKKKYYNPCSADTINFLSISSENLLRDLKINNLGLITNLAPEINEANKFSSIFLMVNFFNNKNIEDSQGKSIEIPKGEINEILKYF